MSHLISLERESSVLEEEDRSRVDFAVVHSFLSFDTSSQGLHTFIKILWIHHQGNRSMDSRDNEKKQQQRIIYICTHPTLLTTIWTPSCSSYCFPDLVLFTLVHDDLESTTEALSNNKSVAPNERRPITMVDLKYDPFWLQRWESREIYVAISIFFTCPCCPCSNALRRCTATRST